MSHRRLRSWGHKYEHLPPWPHGCPGRIHIRPGTTGLELSGWLFVHNRSESSTPRRRHPGGGWTLSLSLSLYGRRGVSVDDDDDDDDADVASCLKNGNGLITTTTPAATPTLTRPSGTGRQRAHASERLPWRSLVSPHHTDRQNYRRPFLSRKAQQLNRKKDKNNFFSPKWIWSLRNCKQMRASHSCQANSGACGNAPRR